MFLINFFDFEAVSCIINYKSKANQCENTTLGSLMLSAYLAIFTLVSVCSKSVSREERGEEQAYENLAIK